MIAWHLLLQKASARQRLWTAAVLALFLQGALLQWHNLHDDLALARWVAWINVVGAILFTPVFPMVLVGGRVPCSLTRSAGSLRQTIPQIHAKMRREYEERGNKSRRF